MKIQLPMTFTVSPRKPVNMMGLVRPSPSLMYRSEKNASRPGMPQLMAWMYPIATGSTSSEMPIAGSNQSAWRMPVNSTIESASTSHHDCRA